MSTSAERSGTEREPVSGPALQVLRLQGRAALRMGLRGVLAMAAVLLVGNLVIIAAHLYSAEAFGEEAPVEIDGIHNLRVVDARVWRGRAPDQAAYAALAGAGVTDVVDLRAERGLDVPSPLLDDLGVTRHHLPIRDGQTPSAGDVDAFLQIVQQADGLVFVHCGAGVGRTGSMAAAYLLATGQASGADVLRANLAVGPPSIEQLWYATHFDGEGGDPPRAVEWLSRTFDAPRRIWSNLRQ